MAESIQQALLRVRPPRVQITYDVEIGGAIEKKQLPFIVGILADLSGQPERTFGQKSRIASLLKSTETISTTYSQRRSPGSPFACRAS